MLIAEAITYRHAGARGVALRDVNLALEDGEVVGLVGPNESGKSTLCLVLAGLAPRLVGGELHGRLLLDGAPTAGLAMHELAGRIGIVFDNPATQLSGVAATVYEEVAFGPSNLALGRDLVIERTEEALALLGIERLADRDPARLSGGQQQLVAIAAILAMRPRHLILDEPTAQLDPGGTTLVGRALEGLAASGASILLVEHKTELIERVAGRVVVLDGGRVALEGSTAAVLGDPVLAELGVAPPASARLRTSVARAGLDTPAVLQAIAEAPTAARPGGQEPTFGGSRGGDAA